MKVEVYKNSDGFLTEDKKQYTEREKLLKRIAKNGSTGVSSDEIKLWYWNKTKEQRKHEDKCRAQIALDNQHCCDCCNGSGTVVDYDYCGRVESQCSNCDGTGLEKQYREATGRQRIYEGTWYRAR